MWPFKKRPKFGGDIKRYGLEEWWSGAFTEAERKKISAIYQPLGGGANQLAKGDAKRQPELNTALFLANLATWLNRPGLADLALKIARKAKQEVVDGDEWDNHFTYGNLCKVFYRWRNEDPQNLDDAIWACEQDITLSKALDPDFGDGVRVSHYCYKQLAIIEEKRGNFQRAIALSKEAHSQGWKGDWEKRIVRLKRKVNNSA